MDSDEDRDGPVSPSVWRYAKATRAHVVIDVDGYFELMRDAMIGARQRIFMIGWDFDTRILLAGGRRWWNLPRGGRYPARLGAFIVWLVRHFKGVEVRILKWNFGSIKFVLRGTMFVDLIRWLINRSIDFKFDSAHPIGCSHHQKIVVIDDRMAVCGGIDMTSDRWDTRAHLHEEPRRRNPNGKFHEPWHDMTMMLEGDVARDLAELGRSRWNTAGGKPFDACAPQDETPWPTRLNAEFRDVEVGIARTRAEHNGKPAIHEIENLFLEHIRRAKRFVYAETQYFASRKIAEAISERLLEPDPPEFVIINPYTADGWLEQTAMDTARVRLVHAMKDYDRLGRFGLFIPFTSGGTPIYVHAKLMIVDDEIIRVGSANMNNRSMGLDTECDVFIDAQRPGNEHIVPAITRIRHSLLAEHCAIAEEDVGPLIEEYGSMAAMIDSRSKEGKRLERYVLPEISDAEKALADSALLDPESPDDFFDVFEPIEKRGLFRRGSLLRRPK
ncbi:MAG: phospholipase [Novosphingobium sp.]|nr:phospholipase [Novosphingobium sp.]